MGITNGSRLLLFSAGTCDEALQKLGLLPTLELVTLQANRLIHWVQKSSLWLLYLFIGSCTHASSFECRPSDGAFSGAQSLVFSHSFVTACVFTANVGQRAQRWWGRLLTVFLVTAHTFWGHRCSHVLLRKTGWVVQGVTFLLKVACTRGKQTGLCFLVGS